MAKQPGIFGSEKYSISASPSAIKEICEQYQCSFYLGQKVFYPFDKDVILEGRLVSITFDEQKSEKDCRCRINHTEVFYDGDGNIRPEQYWKNASSYPTLKGVCKTLEEAVEYCKHWEGGK